MNRPAPFVRLAGSPLGAIVLFFMYGAVVLGWYEGHTAWWLAVGAVGAAMRTLGAVGKVRRYKSWLADWQAMSAEIQPAPPEKKRRGRGWLGIITAAALFFIIPVCLPQIRDYKEIANALAWLWLVDCLFLVFLLLRGILRRLARIRRRSAEGHRAKAEDAPVAWLLCRPSSSPSRLDAMRSLPEYSARLISGAP